MKESLIFTFDTNLGKSRSVAVPDPMPGLPAGDVALSASRFVAAGIFDDAAGSGRPTAVRRVVLQGVQESVWF